VLELVIIKKGRKNFLKERKQEKIKIKKIKKLALKNLTIKYQLWYYNRARGKETKTPCMTWICG
jgi:hypothetical protein